MKPQPFIVVPKDYPKPLDVVGEQVTVLASGAATQGYEIFLQRGPEGSGPPPHAHPWDESFYVMMGEVEFGLEKQRFLVGPGTLVHIPSGTTHFFRIGKGGTEMVSMTSKLGASRMFIDIARSIAPGNPDLEKLSRIAARHEVSISA